MALRGRITLSSSDALTKLSRLGARLIRQNSSGRKLYMHGSGGQTRWIVWIPLGAAQVTLEEHDAACDCGV
jgi:hypothetical protein